MSIRDNNDGNQQTMCEDKLCSVTDTDGDWLEDDPMARNDCLGDDKTNNFKLGVKRPIDFPDAVTSHATRNKPFGALSDT